MVCDIFIDSVIFTNGAGVEPFADKIQVAAFSMVCHVSPVTGDAYAIVSTELCVKLNISVLLQEDHLQMNIRRATL